MGGIHDHVVVGWVTHKVIIGDDKTTCLWLFEHSSELLSNVVSDVDLGWTVVLIHSNNLEPNSFKELPFKSTGLIISSG